jgi:4'-phosphopantetheinyl transferase
MGNEIVWLSQEMNDLPKADDWLSESEKKVLASFRFPKRRNDWKLGRWTVKRAICFRESKDLSVMPAIEVRAAADGAPEAFFRNQPADSSISISHSKSRSLCIAGPAKYALGSDLEWVELREKSFAHDYFTSEELSFLEKTTLDQAIAITLIWSAKESVLKALRQGLRRDSRSVLISPEFGGDSESWNAWRGRCLETSRIFYGWWRTTDNFVYTIASDFPELKLKAG